MRGEPWDGMGDGLDSKVLLAWIPAGITSLHSSISNEQNSMGEKRRVVDPFDTGFYFLLDLLLD